MSARTWCLLAASTVLAVLPITYLIAGQRRSPAEAGVRVHFKTSLPGSAPIEAQLPKELLFQPGEPFTITLRVRNRSHREVWAKVAHKVEPEIMAKYMGMVDCGSFLPFRLAPDAEEENSSTYLVWTDIPKRLKSFTVTFEFDVDKQ